MWKLRHVPWTRDVMWNTMKQWGRMSKARKDQGTESEGVLIENVEQLESTNQDDANRLRSIYWDIKT